MEKAIDDFTLVDWFQVFSIDIWKRIDFTWRTKGLKLYETTITQNLLYSIFQLAKGRMIPVKLLEAKNESINGNDIELAIETNRGFILFPCQAKLIKENGKYRSLSHKVGSRYQIDLLLRYAQKVQGVPLYLFYNCIWDQDRFRGL